VPVSAEETFLAAVPRRVLDRSPYPVVLMCGCVLFGDARLFCGLHEPGLRVTPRDGGSTCAKL